MMTPVSRPRVAVLGAGIVGSWVAYQLAGVGCDVTVYDAEPDTSTRSASFGNAGILALSFAKPMSNPRMLWTGVRSLATGGHDVEIARPLDRSTLRWMLRFGIESRPFRARRAAREVFGSAQRSLELYNELEQREGLDLGLRRTGWLYVASSEEALRQQARAARELAPLGVRAQVVSAAEMHDIEPGLGPTQRGGVLYPDDVSMDPARMVRAVRTAARRHGARFEQGRVESLHVSDNSTASATTDQGAVIRADQFVIATGAESPLLARLLGVRVPVTRGIGWSLTLPTDGPLAGRALMGIEDHVVINPQADAVRMTGGMRFGGPAEQRPAVEQIARLRASAERVLPGIADIDAEGISWLGSRPMTPSGLPFVRRVAPTAVVAAGHGTLGLTLAPESAEKVRSLIIS